MKPNTFLNVHNYIKEMLTKTRVSLPTQKDMTDSKILELTKRLKGASEKETLTNILEWQDRNIQFWLERWIVNLSIIGLICVSFTIGPLYYLLSLNIIIVAPYIGSVLVNAMGTAIGMVLEFIVILIGYLLFLRFTLYKYKKEGWKAVYYTLSPNLPVNKILEYKLALCRDYTRLTASLLFNLYPDSVYFIKTTWHETVGVKLKDEIYVLDQHLPIKTIDNYDENADIYSVKRDLKVKQEPKRTKRKMLSEINTEELTEEVAKIMKIKQKSPKDKPDFNNIRLEKYAKHYYYDEIIKYSLIRAIKNRLEREFCGNIHKISKVTISQDKEDLMLEVYYEGE